jgi:hypothetical protein
MGVLRRLRAKAEQQGIMDFTPIWLGQAALLGREMAATALTLVEEAEQSFDQLSPGRPKGRTAPKRKTTLHRVRERLVSQRTGIINQVRAFMLERGIAVRQGMA